MGRTLLAVFFIVATGQASGVEIHGITFVGSKPVPDAVVWVDAPNAPAERGAPPVLDQRNLDFSPRVLAVRVGTVVEFPNHDRVFHNVFSFHNGQKFDLGLYPTGTMKRVAFDKPGLSRVFCNIHPHMFAYIMAVDTPHFAVSDKNGAFVLKGLPPGTYTYHAWRPGGTEMTGSWTSDNSPRVEVRWP